MSQTIDPPIDDRRRAGSQLRCRAHGALAEWLATTGGSLAITTYTSGKLVLVSSHEGRLRFRTRRFPRPMGLAIVGRRLALAVRRKIVVFRRDGTRFLPLREFTTGKVDAHDIAFGPRGVYFANTRFNCIARVSRRRNFVHCWQPAFLSEIVRKDRCHLNGLGMRDGKPAVATAFCATEHAGGWREQNRLTSGVLIDVARDDVIVGGLCMPHSPRWHDGAWWLCNSGQGTLSRVESRTGHCEDFCHLPGFTRGLSFVGEYALVGLSKIRRKHILHAPPVRKRHGELRAGIALVDLASAQSVGSLEFVVGGNEVYDVVFLPGVRRPNLIALGNEHGGFGGPPPNPPCSRG